MDDLPAMTKRFPWAPPSKTSSKVDILALDAPADEGLGTVLRLVGPFDEIDGDVISLGQSSSKDWSMLIERIQEAARYTRQVETEAQEQELHVQKLLDQAREDLRAAAERVREADARAAKMESQYEAQLKDATARVKAAEKRARDVEELLAQVSDVILREFPVEQVAPRSP